MKLQCFVYPGWRPRLRPAEVRRPWMSEAAESFPYRCLPLNMANAHGWELLSAVGFSARWNGGPAPEDVELRIDPGGGGDEDPVSLFGLGTITFHVPGLMRTEPGWNLFVGGPPNAARDAIAPLSGVIETDWSPYSFTMNWRFTRPDVWVRFEADDPICHMFPVPRAAVESVSPEIVPIESDPVLKGQFEAWSASRDAFQARMRDAPPSRPSEKWQKLYYRGVEPSGAAGAPDHQTKLAVRGFRDRTGAAAAAPGCPVRTAERDIDLAERD